MSGTKDHNLSLLHGMDWIKHILMQNIPISVYTQEPKLTKINFIQSTYGSLCIKTQNDVSLILYLRKGMWIKSSHKTDLYEA